MAGWANQLVLGGYAFGIDSAGLEKFERTTGYRWVSQPRIGRPPAHQFVGADEDEITLSGYIHPHFKGKALEMETLQSMANEGIPYMLTSGTGKVFGLFVITSVKSDFSEMMDDLRPRRVDFTVSLKRYGEDGE